MAIPLLAVMGLGAAAGGLFGGLSMGLEKDRQRTALERQAAMAADAYKYKQQYENASWNLQRGVALENLGIAQGRLAQAFGADVEGFNLGLEGQALQTQSARVSLAEGAGAAMAAQGASGVRGSDSLATQIGFQETQFARQEDLQGRSNSLTMTNMARSYTNQFDDIGREIDSWNPGGYRAKAKGLSDTYSEQMYGLTKRGFDYAFEDMDNPLYQSLDYLTAILGGASQGAQMGSMVGGFMEQLPGRAAAAAPSGGNAYSAPPAAKLSAAFSAATEAAGSGASYAEGTREWGKSMGLELDKNGYWYDPKTMSWNFKGNRNIKLVG